MKPWQTIGPVALAIAATAVAGMHYWKQGFYRSTSPNATTTLYQTGLVRGNRSQAGGLAHFSAHFRGEKGPFRESEPTAPRKLGQSPVNGYLKQPSPRNSDEYLANH